jgi:hypothetical protein
MCWPCFGRPLTNVISEEHASSAYLRAVVGVLCDVLVGQITTPHGKLRKAAVAKVNLDLQKQNNSIT